jgi:nucleotide-binding universal stress UspA family protein
MTREEVWWVTSPGDPPRSGRVLVPVPADGSASAQLAVGIALAAETSAELLLLRPEPFPPATPLPIPDAELADARSSLDATVDSVRRTYDGPLGAVVRAGRSTAAIIGSAAHEHRADYVVLDAANAETRRIARSVDADVVSVSGTNSLDDVRSILAAVGEGPHSRLAARVARELAAHVDGWVELLHVVDSDATDAARENAEKLLESLADDDGPVDVDARLVERSDVTDAVLEESEYHDCSVLGAPTKNRLVRFAFGSTPDAVRADSSGLVVTVWDRGHHG